MSLVHKVSGEIRELSVKELGELVGQSEVSMNNVVTWAYDLNPTSLGVVAVRNLDLWALQQGSTKILLYGPGQTVNPDNITTACIGTAPSNFMYPVALHLRSKQPTE
jgi:hypothetical protein